MFVQNFIAIVRYFSLDKLTDRQTLPSVEPCAASIAKKEWVMTADRSFITLYYFKAMVILSCDESKVQ